MKLKRIGYVFLVLLFLFLQSYILKSLYALKDAVLLLQEQDIAMTKVIAKQAQVLTQSTAKVVDLDQQINVPAQVPEKTEPPLSEQMKFTEEK